MSGSNMYSAVSPLYLVSKLLGMAPFTLIKTGRTGLPNSTRKSYFLFSTLHNYVMFVYLLGWFIYELTWEAIYRYPNLSGSSTIPIVIRNLTHAGTCLSTLIFSHRGTLRDFCSKIALVDHILLGSKASSSYMKTKFVLITNIMVLFVFSVLMFIFNMSGTNVDFKCVVTQASWNVGIAIGSVMLMHFLVFVWILKNRFAKLNAQLATMVVPGLEEETLMSLLTILNPSNKGYFEGEINFINGNRIHNIKDALFLSLSKSKIQEFQYNNNNHIRALRLAHGVLCDTVRTVNSDYGFQILCEIAYAFVSFVMFSFFALDTENDHSLADSEEGFSRVQVIRDFCLSCVCLVKILTIAASCHAVSSEISSTPRIVQKLLSPRHINADARAELQLFSQQLCNDDPRFTAFGFFELDLNLCCSIAGTATTYIVVLLQLK
jgi:hypothetical protein